MEIIRERGNPKCPNVAEPWQNVSRNRPVATGESCLLNRVALEVHQSVIEGEITLEPDQFLRAIDHCRCDWGDQNALRWIDDLWECNLRHRPGLSRRKIGRRVLRWATRPVGKRRRNISKDESSIILVSLIGDDAGVPSACRREAVMADIGQTGWHGEEEPLNGNNVDSVNEVVAVYIRCGERASRWKRNNAKEMSLGRDNIDCVDAYRSGSKCGLGRCDGVIHAAR